MGKSNQKLVSMCVGKRGNEFHAAHGSRISPIVPIHPKCKGSGSKRREGKTLQRVNDVSSTSLMGGELCNCVCVMGGGQG